MRGIKLPDSRDSRQPRQDAKGMQRCWPRRALPAVEKRAIGRTDDFGWNVVEEPVHVNDLHATLLRQFGLDHLRLTYRFKGRDFRLTDVGGKIVEKLIS